ncbi:MAG: imelysin family protein [Microscillaceae bacterium]|nr:imelysin family protein [Microscillaceae bacterium]
MKQTIYKLCGILCLILGLFACSDSGETGSENDFDRVGMLENIADNIILPSFVDLQNKVNALNASMDNFINTSDAPNLTAMQNAWGEAAKSWQYCTTYDFGPASRSLGSLAQVIGTFPVSTTKIEAAISNQDFSLNNFDRDVRGFMAIDYLIFDPNGNNEVLTRYDSNTSGSGDRKQYLKAVINHLKAEVDDVTSQWQTYRNTFVSQNGTSTGSSTSLLFNAFSASFEQVKNFKVGLPAGKRPGQSSPEPTKVEAFYSTRSLELIKEHLNAIEQIWLGKSKNGLDGIGFEEYLNSVVGGMALVQDTKAQLVQMKTALNAIPVIPFSEAVTEEAGLVDAAYTELQKQTRFFKSDMSSLLGIAITFNSGDGD